MVKDAMGDRIKDFYESRSKTYLTRRTYTIIRVDGKTFHTYVKGLKKPFDDGFVSDMNGTAKYLCKNIQGAKFAYVQSDEISVLITDFDDLQTDLWFDGNVQKITSVAASMATSEFNRLRILRAISENKGLSVEQMNKLKMAEFDARVFQIPFSTEVENYFIWRQIDATKNSISAVAQSLYSHKELNGVSSAMKQELIFQKGINWNDLDSRLKRGGFVYKVEKPVEIDEKYKKFKQNDKGTVRNVWEMIECPIFMQNKHFLTDKIPS